MGQLAISIHVCYMVSSKIPSQYKYTNYRSHYYNFCKKKGNIKDLLETAQYLFRALKILAISLIHIKVHHLKSDLVRIEGSLFVDLPKSYPKPSAKKVMSRSRTSKGYCADSMASPGQNKGNKRHLKDKRRLTRT